MSTGIPKQLTVSVAVAALILCATGSAYVQNVVVEATPCGEYVQPAAPSGMRH